MEFDSELAAYDFYNFYGESMGFSIRKNNAAKSKSGEITFRTFVCSEEGHRKHDKRDYQMKNPRAETRIDCDALMAIKLIRQIGKYRVTDFVDIHNHPLVPSDLAHMLPSRRKISASQCVQIDLAHDSGIPLRLCTWHMMKNALKHMNSIFRGPGGVREVLGRFLDEYEEEEEFVMAWNAMLDEYNLRIDKLRQVKRDRDGNLSCSWRLVEMRGVLCSHAIKVLKDAMNIMEIPSQYILKRWTRVAKAEVVQDYQGRDIEADPKLEKNTRYKSLCSLFNKIASRASELKDMYEVSIEQGTKFLQTVEGKLQFHTSCETVGMGESKEKQGCADNENAIKPKGLKKRIVYDRRRNAKDLVSNAEHDLTRDMKFF
ncbi:hypothetical protein RHGRI_010423 [Rhododendron griersonianum]|uniref:Protein FAR1-RELATED SEQUENCE n=1 Tax=Rhododendron griersonianum TaxID=479676 RepID=A0AAV6KJ50_9ERIC|nr:hypothetical protein RHGRI_010423 [Rhododendron griersonianum]